MKQEIEVYIDEIIDEDNEDIVERLFVIPLEYQPREETNGIMEGFWFVCDLITSDTGETYSEEEFVQFCKDNGSDYDIADAISEADQITGDQEAESRIEAWESRYDQDIDYV